MTTSEKLVNCVGFKDRLYQSIFENVKNSIVITPIFTDEELVNYGFTVVNTPIIEFDGYKYHKPNFEIDGKKYHGRKNKLYFDSHSIFKETEFDVKSDPIKVKIIDAIRKIGYTHLIEVNAITVDFYFELSGDYNTERGVTVMVTGSTIKPKKL